MTTKTEIISLKDYNLIGILDNEIDAVEEMFDQSGYLCDAISSVADGFIPIHNGEIWENASAISEYIEDAISEGIAPVSSGDVDLMGIFQAGYYQYYTQVLYDNLEAFVYNYVVDKVNEYLNTLDDISKIDIGELESTIEDATGDIDNNNTFDDLNDIVTDLTERIDEDEFIV